MIKLNITTTAKGTHGDVSFSSRDNGDLAINIDRRNTFDPTDETPYITISAADVKQLKEFLNSLTTN